MAMRHPRLLDSSLNELARLQPSRLSVTENLTPLSTAELTLPMGEATPVVRQFVELYDQNGSLGIYRVAAARTDYGQMQTVSLEHGICTLEDCTAPEEAELSGSMRTILTAILSWQHDVWWQLGDVDVPEDAAFALSEGNQIALQALIDAAALCYGYALVFDQTTSPWTMHLRALPTEVTSECRLARNVSAVGIAWDESELCTRVTSSLLENGYMDGPTAGEWGVISRPLDVTEDATAEAAAQLAAEYLDAHKDPRISVEIDALELGALTGEPYDSFALGGLCRVALPDWGVTAIERIVSAYRPDVYGAPEEVQLTLSTMVRSTQASLAGLRSSMARSNRSNAQQFKYIREEIDKIVIEAPSIELVARVTQLEETSNDLVLEQNELGIRLDAAEAEILLKAYQDAVDAQERRISNAEVRLDADEALIELKADRTTTDALGKRVSAAEIAIDGAKSQIALKADLILLDGYVKAEELEAVEAQISNLTGGLVTATALKANTFSGTTCSVTYLNADSINHNGTLVSQRAVTMGEVSTTGKALSTGDMDLQHSHKVTVGDDGTVTLGEVSAEGGNFKIADTKVYKDGVSAAKDSVTLTSAGWVNGSNVVNASNGKSLTVSLPPFKVSGGDTFSGNKTTVFFYTDGVPNPLQSKKVDASAVYDDGYSSGAAGVTLSADGWSGLTNTVRASNGKTYVVPFPTINLTGGDSWNSSHETIVNAMTPGSSAYITRLTVDATSVYNDGSSAGYASGKSDWRPTIVSRTGVDTTNKTVTVSVSNLSQTLLTNQVVSAVEVYDAGYSTGYSAGYAAAKAGVTVQCGVSGWSNPAQYYARVTVFANAILDGVTIASGSSSSSKNISGYV